MVVNASHATNIRPVGVFPEIRMFLRSLSLLSAGTLCVSLDCEVPTGKRFRLFGWIKPHQASPK